MSVLRPDAVVTDEPQPAAKLVRCGIVGFGKMGRIRSAAIESSGRGQVVATFDTADHEPPASAARLKSDFGVIEHPDVDAVFICTPNFRNKPLTIAAMEAGKHVFCEKPPALTASDLEDVMEAERRTGARLMYGFNHRHHESIRIAKARIDSGEFGDVLWMRGRYGKSVDESFFEGWRADRSKAGGGILLDQGIHMLDLLLYFGSDFDDVQAMVSNLFWNIPGIEDNVFANLRCSRTGVVASLHSTMTQWRHLFSLEIFLSRGHVVLNGLKTSSNSYGDEVLTLEKNRFATGAVAWEEPEAHTFHVDTSWSSEIDHFFDAVQCSTPIREGRSEDAMAVMRLIERIYDAG